MKCDHIIGFHGGHEEIKLSEAEECPELLTDTCCGGVHVLNYCPLCGEKLDINKLLEKAEENDNGHANKNPSRV